MKSLIHDVEGARLTRPDHCSDSLWGLMNQCWIEEPDLRITFAEVSLTYFKQCLTLKVLEQLNSATDEEIARELQEKERAEHEIPGYIKSII